jgi:hypothetical protein
MTISTPSVTRGDDGDTKFMQVLRLAQQQHGAPARRRIDLEHFFHCDGALADIVENRHRRRDRTNGKRCFKKVSTATPLVMFNAGRTASAQCPIGSRGTGSA